MSVVRLGILGCGDFTRLQTPALKAWQGQAGNVVRCLRPAQRHAVDAARKGRSGWILLDLGQALVHTFPHLAIDQTRAHGIDGYLGRQCAGG